MTNSYYRLGDGPTRVIALHGWFGNHRAFAPLWPYLDGVRFSYVFMDYRGYGRSVSRPRPRHAGRARRPLPGAALAAAVAWRLTFAAPYLGG